MSNGWDEYKQFVIRDLTRLEENVKQLDSKFDDHSEKINGYFLAIREDVSNLREDVSSLKTEVKIKSGVWGALSGFVVTLGALIIALLKGTLG